MEFLANNNNVRILGRSLMIDHIRYLNYSSSAVEFIFTGKDLWATLWTNGHQGDEIYKAWVAVFVDDELTPSKRFSLDVEEKDYMLYHSNQEKTVKIRLVKISEEAFGKVGIISFKTDTQHPIIPTKEKQRKMEFIGDSLTCGYGIEGTFEVDVFNTAQENCWTAYAARCARAFDADYHLVAWSGIGIVSAWVEETVDEPLNDWLMPMLYQYTDASLCKDLNMQKEDWEVWNHSHFVPDIIVINLGTNDASYVRNIPERITEFEKTYYQFLEYVREHNRHSTILCTLGVMGQDLCPVIHSQVERFAKDKKDTNIFFMEFDVQLESDGIGSDWHPSETTHCKMAEKLTNKIKELKKW
ncbi:MAG TPA: GDSL-type esterase/lipase family protein [Lachnospiraceae bacterium]|nr:GDSL-type esterase/lipase family protein [Lachnospiraceae bacterium]